MLNYTVLNNRFYSSDMTKGLPDIKHEKKNMVFMLVDQVDEDIFVHETCEKIVKKHLTSICFYGRRAYIWQLCCESLNRSRYPFQDKRRFQAYEVYEDYEAFVTELQNCLEIRDVAPYEIFILYDEVAKYNMLINDPRIKPMLGKF